MTGSRAKDPARALLPTSRPLRLLAPDGTRTAHAGLPLDLKDDDLMALYRFMVVTRRADREAVHLQRQGQVGAYPPNLGQEAAQVGPAYALGEQDWLFPAYRELGALLVRGLPPSAVVHVFRGTWHSAHNPAASKVGLLCLPIATQTLHATGFAMGAALDDAPLVVLTYLGDGAASEGDAHEAFNFAAVFNAPVVFIVQNNQYAISVPADRQSRAPSLAHRAVGYGMPGVLVDGNDVLACYAATRRAVDRAREGHGPSLIEARTYRMDGHSTADDWTRYRTQDELDTWTDADPVLRLGRHLRAGGLLDDAIDDSIQAAAEDAAVRLREEIWDAPAPEPTEMFDHVFAAPPMPLLRRQRARLAAELAAARPEPGTGS